MNHIEIMVKIQDVCMAFCGALVGAIVSITLILVVCAFSLSGVILLVLGSVCVDDLNHDKDIRWCPERGWSITMLVIGCLLVAGSCAQILRNKETQIEKAQKNRESSSEEERDFTNGNKSLGPPQGYSRLV